MVTNPVRCRRNPMIDSWLTFLNLLKILFSISIFSILLFFEYLVYHMRIRRKPDPPGPTVHQLVGPLTTLINLNKFVKNGISIRHTISGPPESPLQESFPPSLYPAQTISGQILTLNNLKSRANF